MIRRRRAKDSEGREFAMCEFIENCERVSKTLDSVHDTSVAESARAKAFDCDEWTFSGSSRRRALRIKKRASDHRLSDDDHACDDVGDERSYELDVLMRNVCEEAATTTALADLLFFSSPKSVDGTSRRRGIKVAGDMNSAEEEEEEREREREEEEKEANDFGRGKAYLMRRRNKQTGNEYWTIIAKAYRDESDERLKKMSIKTRSFRIDDPEGKEAKENALKFALSRAFNDWLFDQPIAKNPRKAGLGGSRTRAMKHPCAYTGVMGDDFIDCFCGDNEEYGFMLACETCGAWEHGECCGVKSEEAIPEGYACSTCVKEKNAFESFPKIIVCSEGENGADENDDTIIKSMLENGEIIVADENDHDHHHHHHHNNNNNNNNNNNSSQRAIPIIWGLQSFVATSLGIDVTKSFQLPAQINSSNLVNSKRRCVCCVCGCEHTDEIEPMVKACNCLGGGALAHRDCLEDWEDENTNDKKSSGDKNAPKQAKKKTVDGIVVNVIKEETSLPVTPSGTRSWKVNFDDFPTKSCRACCGFGGLASGGIKDYKEAEAIIQNQKRVLAEATAKFEANAKAMRGKRPGAAKVLVAKEEDGDEDDPPIGSLDDVKPIVNGKKTGRGSPSDKKEKKAAAAPKIMTNKQEKKQLKGSLSETPLIRNVKKVKVKKEETKILNDSSANSSGTVSTIPLKKRRLMMFEQEKEQQAAAAAVANKAVREKE